MSLFQAAGRSDSQDVDIRSIPLVYLHPTTQVRYAGKRQMWPLCNLYFFYQLFNKIADLDEWFWLRP
jgi:hypothetical protein